MPLLDDQPLVRLTAEEVEAMFAAGIFDDDRRIEFVDGLLLEVSPSGPLHSGVVAWLNRHLANAVGDGEVRVQDVLFIAGGWLSPDLIVIADRPRTTRVTTAVLAIEVAVTTGRYDRRKAEYYARAGVGEYWIVEPGTRTVLVHRDVRTDDYAAVTRYADGEFVPAPLGAPAVDVTALFGPQHA